MSIKFSSVQKEGTYAFSLYFGIKSLSCVVSKGKGGRWTALSTQTGFVGRARTRKEACEKLRDSYQAYLSAIADNDVVYLAGLLSFSLGNGKLNKSTLIWAITAGLTCPAANLCRSHASYNAGVRVINDGPTTQFRCFAASAELQYTETYASRRRNWTIIKAVLAIGFDFAVQVLSTAIASNTKDNTELIRIHESGDFFSPQYRDLWFAVLAMFPSLKGYAYSKNLPLFLNIETPANFYLTASYGGEYDNLIDQGLFPRYAKVFMTEQQALNAGLPIDVDDRHCFLDGPFALLVHGTQPRGTDAAKMAFKHSRERKALKAKYALV